jgi:hypothetical protein
MKSVIRIVAAVGVLGLAAGAWALEPPEQYRVWGARAKAHPYLADPGLDEIAGKIVLRTDAYDPIGGGRVPVQPPGTYDEWRGRIAELIAQLSTPQ